LIMLLNLPEDAWRSIALNLPAPDILTFLSSHRQIHESLGKSSAFWEQLLCRDCDKATGQREGCCAEIRKEYMIQAYSKYLASAKWYPVTRSFAVSAREGHLACVLNGPEKEQRICVTGGYSSDEGVYILHVPSKQNQTEASSPVWAWSRLGPQAGHGTNFAYGASLTPLGSSMENGCHVACAVRFGGFQSGGYSNETNQVWLLTVKDEPPKNPGESSQLTASWEMVPTTNPQLAAPRAYHTATLIAGRYLVIIGGMMWRESILTEAILDTQTWTWSNQRISTFGDEKPSGRHGHSVVFDSRRNRLVLFGGGSGTDLLRSGTDNSEVWELKMNDDWESTIRLPWTWSKVHEDSKRPRDDSDSDNERDQDDDEDEEFETNGAENNRTQQLSSAESLCLGRCHHGIKVAPDTAILLFGSGRPSTNGVIGYDLRTDTFLRPNITGSLPKPRFSGVATYLETEGYLFAHGGYTSQESDCIADMSILDLAPYLDRDFGALPVDSHRRSYREINDADAERGRVDRFGGNILEQHQFMAQILAMTRGGEVSVEEVQNFLSNRGTIRIGNDGVIIIRPPDESDDDSDDSDYIDVS
jgi:hypothetical protein